MACSRKLWIVIYNFTGRIVFIISLDWIKLESSTLSKTKMSPAIVALAAKRLFCPRRDKHHHQWRVEHRRNLNKYGYQYEYWLNEDQLFDGHILQSQANVKSTSKYGSKLSQLLIIHRIALLMLILSVTTLISVFRLVVYRFDNPTNSFGKDSFFTR